MTRSLRFRLAAGALIAIAVALSLVWIVLGELFEDYIADQYTNEMTAVSDALSARLAIDGTALKLASEPSDPRFQIPAGGRYWQITPDGSQAPLRSRSLWDLELSSDNFSKDLYCGFYQTEGPDGGAILVAMKNLAFGQGSNEKRFIVYTGFSKQEMENALETYQRPLRLMLLSTGGILAFAAFLQSAIGLRPLSRLRRDVSDIRAGRSAHMSDKGPSEVRPLVNELNLLLAERETAVERARARASDLAHGLKTPLTVLSQLVESLPAERQQTAMEQIDLIRQRADRQLQATRMGAERMSSTSLLGISQKLVSALTPITDEKGVDWRLNIDAGLTVQTDPADLAEALGNILENAVRFAERRIELTAAKNGKLVSLHVGDDGPGATPDNYSTMLKRGGSESDQAPHGTGLGLAIAGDIAQAYGGQLNLARSRLGGLEVVLRLPAA